MDAMDELQEADILWPDTEDDDDVVMEVAHGSVSSVAPVFGRRLEVEVEVEVERFFHPGAGGGVSSSSAAASPGAGDDEEEWQEADVLWPNTVGVVVVARGGCGGLLLPFPSGSGRGGRHGNPAADRRERRWRAAASSPIDIPTNVAAVRRLNLGRP